MTGVTRMSDSPSMKAPRTMESTTMKMKNYHCGGSMASTALTIPRGASAWTKTADSACAATTINVRPAVKTALVMAERQMSNSPNFLQHKGISYFTRRSDNGNIGGFRFRCRLPVQQSRPWPAP